MFQSQTSFAKVPAQDKEWGIHPKDSHKHKPTPACAAVRHKHLPEIILMC